MSQLTQYDENTDIKYFGFSFDLRFFLFSLYIVAQSKF